MRSLVLIAGLLVAACAGGTAQQQVFSLHGHYNTALAAAVQYESLPRCGDVVQGACSNPDVVAKLRQADDVAFAALEKVETIARSGDPDQGLLRVLREAAALEIGKFIGTLATFGIGGDS